MAPISEVESDDFVDILAQTREFVRTQVVPREQEIADTGTPIGNFQLVQAMIEMVGKVDDLAVQIHGGGLVKRAQKNMTSGGR